MLDTDTILFRRDTTRYINQLTYQKLSICIHQEFYIHQYYGSAFKVPLVGEWLVLVSGPQMVDDIRRAGANDMSFDDATAEVRLNI